MKRFAEDHKILCLLILAAVTVLPYIQSVNYPFQYDDVPYIFENPEMDELTDIKDIKFSQRPVRKISLIIDRALFGSNPAGYRAVNILLYLLSVFLTGVLMLTLTKNYLFSLIAVIIMGFHPIHTSSVLIVTHRKEMLMFIFAVSSMIAHINKKHILAVACFLLALLSKETAVLLPVVFLLYDTVFAREKNRKVYSIYGGILFAGIIGVLLFSEKLGFFMPAIGGMDEFLEKNRLFREISYIRIILMQPRIFITYIAHLLVPVNLNLDYHLQVNRPFAYELIFFLLTGVYFYLIYYFRKSRYVLFGLLFFLINYLPISNIIPVLNLVSDRYLFFPSIALFFIIYPLYKRFRLSRYIFTVYTVFLIIVTMSLIPKYRSEQVLWSYVIEKNPMSAVGHNNIALHYLSNNNMSSAQRHLERAYSIDSTYAESAVNLAVVYARLGRTGRAIDMLEGIVREQDYHIKALYNLSLLYVRTGQFAEAEKTLKRIIEVSPSSQQPYNNLGTLYFRRGLEYEQMISPSIAVFCYPLTGLVMDLTMENYMLADSVFGEGDGEKMSKIKTNREIVKKKLMEDFR